MLVIMVLEPTQKIFIPVMYIICTGKSHALYQRIFSDINNLLGKPWRPKVVITDFESAFLKLFK
jgi:hypothetical protein